MKGIKKLYKGGELGMVGWEEFNAVLLLKYIYINPAYVWCVCQFIQICMCLNYVCSLFVFTLKKMFCLFIYLFNYLNVFL